MPTLQFNLTSFTNKNADLRGGASFSAYASGAGVANAMVTAVRLTLNNIRIYSTQCFLELVKGSGIGTTANFAQNPNIHNQTVSLISFASALAQSGDGPIVFTVRASSGSTGNLINLRDNVSGVLETDYFIPQSDFSLDKAELDAGQTITATITPTHPDADHEIIWRFQTAYKDYSSIQSDSASYTAPFGKSLTVPLTWLDAIPNSESGLATVTVNTYMGGVLTGSVTKQFTIKAGAAIVPNISSLSAARINNGVPSAWAEYVQGISGVQLTANGVSGVYGSSIVEIKMTGGGVTGFTSPYSTPAINAIGTVTFTCQVTDSRGRKKSVTVSVTFRAYDPPRIDSIDAIRCNSDGTPNDSGTYVLVTANYTIASVNGKNAVASMVTSRRPYVGGDYTQIYTTIKGSGVAYVAGSGFVAANSYVVRVGITDGLYYVEATDIVPTESWLLHYRVGGRGVAIGMISQRIDAFEVNPAWEIYYKGQTLDARFGNVDTSGIRQVPYGGTGLASVASGSYLRGAGVGALQPRTPAQVLADIGAAAALHTHVKANISDFAHTHPVGEITGTLPVASGGTGLVNVPSGNYLRGAGTGPLAPRTPAQVLADIGAAAAVHAHGAGDLSGVLPLTGGTMTGAIGNGSTTDLIIGTGALEQHVTFQHCGTGDQTVFLYGASPTSGNVIGLWDGTNARSVWAYSVAGSFSINRPFVVNDNSTLSGNVTIRNPTAGARTTIYQYSNDTTVPTDFRFGGTTGVWTLTGRGSGESYMAGFYNYSAGKYALQLFTDGSAQVNGTFTAYAGYLKSVSSGKSIQIGSWNTSYCHYNTDADVGHWFNKGMRVEGEIYAGPSYNKRVYHAGNLLGGPGIPSGGVDGDIWLQHVA